MRSEKGYFLKNYMKDKITALGLKGRENI